MGFSPVYGRQLPRTKPPGEFGGVRRVQKAVELAASLNPCRNWRCGILNIPHQINTRPIDKEEYQLLPRGVRACRSQHFRRGATEDKPSAKSTGWRRREPVDATGGALRATARMATAFMGGREAAGRAELGGAENRLEEGQSRMGAPVGVGGAVGAHVRDFSLSEDLAPLGEARLGRAKGRCRSGPSLGAEGAPQSRGRRPLAAVLPFPPRTAQSLRGSI